MFEMLRSKAVLFFLAIGTACGCPAAASTWHIRPVECKTGQNNLTDEAQVFQSFEHPEESVIGDLDALPQPQQRCSLLHKRNRLPRSNRAMRLGTPR
jgi:hypothetical protein